ncbi:MAG: hypothetical protein ABW039_01735 [Sphingobium sp.]
MGRAIFAHLGSAPAGHVAEGAGLRALGDVETLDMVTGDDRPLHLRVHHLERGATLYVDGPPVGHIFYLGRGQAEVDDQAILPGGAVIVEHHGSAAIEAREDGTLLFEFSAQAPSPPEGVGGQVHVVPQTRPEKHNPVSRMMAACLIDGTCPSCALWMHHSEFPPHFKVPPHLHSEDEIILVIAGDLTVGGRVLDAGAAAAIDSGTAYAFQAGDRGVAFVNFRPSSPGYAMVERGRPAPLRSEHDAHTALPAAPQSEWCLPAPDFSH